MLAGVDPYDAAGGAAGLPPVDSLNQWDAMIGVNRSGGGRGPRSEIFMTPLNDTVRHGCVDSALIVGEYKLIVGCITQASWCGPSYPNNSVRWDTWATVLQCPVTPTKVGCLFNIYDDPTEHVDLAASELARAKDMYARLVVLNDGFYDPNRGASDARSACEVVVKNGGTWGPWL